MIIDVENDIFTDVCNIVKESYPDASVYGELVLAPSSFPCVTVEEIDNYVSSKYVDSEFKEKYANITYEINVYSNKTSGKKGEAKSILAIADAEMLRLGFRRTSKNPVSMENTTIYRVTARYSAVTSDTKIIYGG